MAASQNVESDADIVRRALREKEVFALLIERYDARLRRYVRRLGIRNQNDVDDLMQDIFIKTYRNLNDFDQSLSFSAWIYRIAHNETMSWFRKHRVRPEGHLADEGDDIVKELRASEDIERELSARMDAALVTAALERLNPRYREVLILRFFEHCEYQEISDILEIPIGSVATLLHRAKKELRDALQTTHYTEL